MNSLRTGAPVQSSHADSPLTVPRLKLGVRYARSAAGYWLSVFPRIRREMGFWRDRANAIPDSTLRALALEAHRSETAKVEGAGAFAVLAPPARREALLRAQVAFVTLYNYLDALSEQPGDDPVRENERLHQAMLAALAPVAPHVDYYAYRPRSDDGGYLHALIDRCRSALATLPSYRRVSSMATAMAEDVVRYQTLNLPERWGGHAHLAQWAQEGPPLAAELRWWERAAGSIRGVGIVALMTAAAKPDLARDEAERICAAYYPWVEALCTLLDSAADEEEDLAAGRPSLLSHYSSPEEAALRVRMISTEAVSALSGLPDALGHLLIFAGMLGSYLAPPPPTLMGRAIAAPVLETVGPLERPTVLIFRARDAARRLAAFAPGGWQRSPHDGRRQPPFAEPVKTGTPDR
jgi:tetraprenyl-beta-curcumene synthase